MKSNTQKINTCWFIQKENYNRRGRDFQIRIEAPPRRFLIKMTNIFIFHGTGGHPEENWFPWLKKKLEKLDCKILIPKFPTPKNQTLENWLKILKNYEQFYNENSILVGHSLGGAFLLRVLEKYDNKIKAAFIIAAPIGKPPIKNYEADKLFLGKNFAFDWDKIKSHCRKFFVFHSDNDPYISLGNGKALTKKLNTKLIFIPNAGHFNESAGYSKFDALFE